MDFVLLLLLLLATVDVNGNGKFVDGSMERPKIDTEAKVFEIDNKKLQQYWQYATTMALIKAHTRSTLESLPPIERIVFEQCAGDAETVIAVSKCAVKVLNARETANLSTTTQRSSQMPSQNLSTTILKQIYVSPSRIYVEKNIGEHPATQKITPSSYYSNIHHQWVKNPIKKQKKQKRFKRRDEMMEAYDLFLEEQRKLKKAENVLRKISEEPIERNMFGLPRHMSMPRLKRNIEAGAQQNKENASTSRPAIDIPKLATKYFQKLVEGKIGQVDHLDNIRRIRNHYLRVQKCNGYFKLMNDENKKVFDHLKLKINSQTPIIHNDDSGFQKIVDIVNEFSASKISHQKFSFFSPRILSIMPEDKPKNRFLSPTLLSFQKDGFFSLPDLFEIVSSNQNYQKLMLEGILDLSGAGIALQELLAKLEPEMQFMEQVQYPMVQQLSRQDIRWLKVRQLFSKDQSAQYQQYGYAHLNEEQVGLLYSDDAASYIPITQMTRNERNARIEDAIRKLAAEGRPQWPYWNGSGKRFKRADNGEAGHAAIPNYPEGEHIGAVEYMVLKPHAFANLINFGVSMEAMVLSPHAFISEILRPEALKLDVLSPRAFIATVLSPSALIARVLSPTAFRAEVLSPRALTAWVLSPEALIAEVLTPRFLEPRVLSPEALVIDVLSPGILSPHVLSSEAVGVMILSPNILSPRIASDEKFLVEVLSPHILGGPHSKEEEHSNIEIGSGSHEDHEHREHAHSAENNSNNRLEHHQPHRSIFHHGAPTSIRYQSQIPRNPFFSRFKKR